MYQRIADFKDQPMFPHSYELAKYAATFRWDEHTTRESIAPYLAKSKYDPRVSVAVGKRENYPDIIAVLAFNANPESITDVGQMYQLTLHQDGCSIVADESNDFDYGWSIFKNNFAPSFPIEFQIVFNKPFLPCDILSFDGDLNHMAECVVMRTIERRVGDLVYDLEGQPTKIVRVGFSYFGNQPTINIYTVAKKKDGTWASREKIWRHIKLNDSPNRSKYWSYFSSLCSTIAVIKLGEDVMHRNAVYV